MWREKKRRECEGNKRKEDVEGGKEKVQKKRGLEGNKREEGVVRLRTNAG